VAEGAHVFWKLAHKDQKATDEGRLGIFTNGSFAPGRLDVPGTRRGYPYQGLTDARHRGGNAMKRIIILGGGRTMERGGRRAEARRTRDPIERD